MSSFNFSRAKCCIKGTTQNIIEVLRVEYGIKYVKGLHVTS